MKIHAHFESRSSDCDGTYDRTYVVTPTEKEIDSPSGDIDFHERVVGMVVNTYSILLAGSLHVHKFEDGSVRLEWTEQTEEGGIATTVTLCEDETCDTEEPSTFRDHTAERAGY
jgi:hypothetical protein